MVMGTAEELAQAQPKAMINQFSELLTILKNWQHKRKFLKYK
jgi:phosphoglycolate phosphatase-like HAD superfamily hydrolase